VTVTVGPISTATAPPIQPPKRRMPYRSPVDQPVWARPVLLAVAVLAGAVYAAGIRHGLVHSYYAPAVKSMSERVGERSGTPGTTRQHRSRSTSFPAPSWLRRCPRGSSASQCGRSCCLRWSKLFSPSWFCTGSYGAGLAGVRALFAAAAFATTPIVAALAHAEISDTLLTLLLILAAAACQRAVAGGRLG
jgi:hypothetical protein